MASYYWIKMYHEVLHDPKMGRLSDHLWRRFFELCLMAGELDEDGYLPPVRDMAWTLRTAGGDLEADLHLLSEEGLISLVGDRWLVCKFSTRQAPIGARERKQRQRERDKKSDYYGHDTVTKDVTNRDTDTDTDTDTDQDADAAADNIARDAKGDAAVADVLQELFDIGVKGKKASSLIVAYQERGELPELVPRMAANIAHYTGKDGVKNPIGLAITQTESGHDPPASGEYWAQFVEEQDRRRYIEGPHAAIIEH